MHRTSEQRFVRMGRKEHVKTGHPSRKSVGERLRFTSNAGEFTAATLTTGCRRNASSARGTGATLTRTKPDAFIDETNGGKLPVCEEQSGKGGSYICVQWFSTTTVSQTLCT